MTKEEFNIRRAAIIGSIHANLLVIDGLIRQPRTQNQTNTILSLLSDCIDMLNEDRDDLVQMINKEET